MKMNLIKALSVGAVLALGMSFNAFAAISITPAVAAYSGLETSQSDINKVIFPLMGTDTEELYKQNVGENKASGDYADSYKTTFANTEKDPSEATISWVEGTPFIGPVAWLLVKDGAGPPGWYLFNLTGLGWDGKATLNLTAFWPNSGAISHVTLYGTPGTDVPEPGTLALLGMGLVGFGIARRRRRS